MRPLRRVGRSGGGGRPTAEVLLQRSARPQVWGASASNYMGARERGILRRSERYGAASGAQFFARGGRPPRRFGMGGSAWRSA